MLWPPSRLSGRAQVTKAKELVAAGALGAVFAVEMHTVAARAPHAVGSRGFWSLDPLEAS